MAVGRVVLPVVLVIILAPVLGIVASAEQPLAADLQHGIIIWSGSKMVYKNNQPVWDNWLRLYVGPDDVRRIKQWGSAYVVVRVLSIDRYLDNSPMVKVHVYRGESGSGAELYASDWVDVPGPGAYEIPVPSWIVESLPDDGFRLGIELYPNWDTTNGDSYYGVRISQVILAPPQGVIREQQAQPVQEPMTGQLERRGFDAKTVAVAGLGGLVLGVVMMQAVARRR